MRTPDLVAAEVREIANGVGDWQTLADLARGCTACPPLALTRRTVVVGRPPGPLSMLLVGEAPGAAEDASGQPFVGRAGVLLDTVLSEAGVTRDEVGIANVLKCRPPGNRAPTRIEAGRCTSWLDRQVALTDPRVVVTMGGSAAAWAFGRGVRLADVRGRSHSVERCAGRLIVPTYHPSAALRFGPQGEPRRLLGVDLAYAVGLARSLAS